MKRLLRSGKNNFANGLGGQVVNGIDCLCIGDAFMDFTILPGMRKKVIHGGTVNGSPIICHPGGVGNVAFTVALLGGASAFCGCVGHDVLGEAYRRDLVNNGVTPLLSYSKLPTGTLFSFLSRDGERSFLASRGANNSIKHGHIRKAIAKTRPRVIYFSGHSLADRDSIEALTHAFDNARSYPVKIIFDCTPYNKVSTRRRLFRKLLGKSQCVCLNLKEARALIGKKTPLTIVQELRSDVEFVALKMGRNGCIMARGDELIELKAPKVKVLDSTGAGDAFAAAVAFGISRGLSLRAIARLAVKMSAIKVQNHGPRIPSTYDRSRVLAL